MAEPSSIPDKVTRRIRPWIAGLLTILGLGVGLFYAGRTRAALYMAAISIALGAVLAIAGLAYLYLNGPTQLSFIDPNSFSTADMVSLAISVVLAIGVGVFVFRNPRVVNRAGPARLLGYFGIWLAPIIGAAAIALVLRMFLLQPFHIPSGAMKPTLQVGDYLVVDKTSFGYSKASLIYPFTRMAINGRVFANTPERGDVVVFKNRKDGNQDYVKRLIGMPGDTVQMLGGRLQINGAPVAKELVTAYAPEICGPSGNGDIYRETLDNGVSYIVQECFGDEGMLDNTAVYQVPDGHFFMLGDNRDQSQDSRVISQVGYVHFDSLVGKARLTAKASD